MNKQENNMTTMNLLTRPARLRLWLLLCLFVSAMAAQASTWYWQGNGDKSTTRQWNTVANWTPNPSGGGSTVLPNFVAPGDDLVFGAYTYIENTLNTRPTPGAFYANSMTFTCNGWLVVLVTSSTDKIILGAGGIINNLGNVTGTSTAGNVPNPPINELRCQMELGANATIWNYDTNQPIKCRTLDILTTNSFLDLKTYTLTLDGPGTNGFSTPTAGSHYGGSIKGTGGVVKNGTGSTSFSATNTYTGPTVVNAGQLIVKTWSLGGGAYAVADGANLQVTVGSAGTTLRTSSLGLTNTTGALNTNTLALALSSYGNPTVPVVYATNLTLNGTVYLTVTGSGLAPGTIPLIQYNGSILGGGALVTNSLPQGVGAYLTNNTSAHQIQLVVSSVPSLRWTGLANSVLKSTWDINVTSNWVNTASAPAVPDFFFNGLPVVFDDTGSTNLVILATNVVPYTLTVSNTTKTYTLIDDGVSGFQANPSAGIIKDGSGTFILGMTNSYTSSTYIKQGTLKTAIANAIGRGMGNSGAALTNNGMLDLNGFSQNIGMLYGNGVITNSSSTPVILQAQAGGVDGGTFTGRIDEGTLGGQIQFNKSGGILLVTGNNNYSAGTHFITGGAAATRQITLGGNNVLGTGPIVIEVTSILAADASPRTLNNTITWQNVNNGFTFGQTGAGLLTLSGPFSISSAADATFTLPSDLLLSGPLTSSGAGLSVKEGPGTLRLLNNTCSLINLTADTKIQDGTMIVDGATVTVIGVTAPTFRVQSLVTNGTASLYLTNNGSLTVGNGNGYYRLRLGDTASPTNSLGQQCTTNIVDIHGTLIADGVTLGYSGSTITTNNPGPSATYTTNWNGGGAYARLNLQPGSQATLNQISASPSKTVTEVYLDGATINVFDNASSSFLQGLSNVFIKSGGVTLNGANTSSLHIRQSLHEGSPGGGGLTWNGTNDGNGFAGIGVGDTPQATMLQLDGTNTYPGTTLINVGTLGGIGTLAGPLVFASGSSLYPGGGGNLGTLTVNNNATLNSGVHCSFELNTTNSIISGYTTNGDSSITTNYVRLSNTNDMLVVSGILSISGATLTVNNNGPTNVLGDYFKLFSKAAVGFTNVTLPTLDAGLAWQDNLAVDGSIQVVVPSGAPPVGFPPGEVTLLSDGNISLTVTGAVGTAWSLHATNDAALPQPWPVIQSGSIITSPFPIIDLTATNSPRRFYRLSTP